MEPEQVIDVATGQKAADLVLRNGRIVNVLSNEIHDADVAIVGAGYTGLSTAYYLRRSDPSLRVVVLESDFVGYGGSGRNGGCLKPQLGMGPSSLVRRLGLEGARAAHRFMLRAVERRPPKAWRGVSIRYGTQIGVRPPTFVVFTTDLRAVDSTYRRYLANQLRSEYGFGGTPIRILARKKA